MSKNLTLGLCVLAICAALVFVFQATPAPAGPAGITGTPNFLPMLFRPADTPTPTDTPTGVPSATPTATNPPPPASLHITTLSGTTTPEFVIITNSGGQAQDMTGWTLVSVVGPQTFDFPSGFTLQAGHTVRIESYTGAGNNPPAVLFWTTDPVWNNAGDKAELRDNTNALIDSACYGNACP